MIMIQRQICAAVLAAPALLLMSGDASTIIAGLIYIGAVSTIIAGTNVGRRFLRGLYRDALHLDSYLQKQVR